MNLSDLLVASARCKALLNQAIIDLNNGNFSDALVKLDAALDINPNDVYALQYRGICQCLLVREHEGTNQENRERLHKVALDLLQVINSMEQIKQATLSHLS